MEQELIDWRPTLAIEFSEKASEFKDRIRTEIACKKCSSRVDVCANCFYAYIYSWLKVYDNLLAEEFTAFFDMHDYKEI